MVRSQARCSLRWIGLMVRMGRVAGAKVSGYQKFRTANFAGQFQPDGDGFLYRKGMKGAPIRVTAAERQRYIEEFEKSGRFVFWAGVTVGVLAPLALVFYSASGFDLSDWTVWA